MAQELLNGGQLLAVVVEHRGEKASQGMKAHALLDAGPLTEPLHGLPAGRVCQTVPPLFEGGRGLLASDLINTELQQPQVVVENLPEEIKISWVSSPHACFNRK